MALDSCGEFAVCVHVCVCVCVCEYIVREECDDGSGIASNTKNIDQVCPSMSSCV